MNRIKLLLAVTCLFFTFKTAYPQDYQINEKSIVGVFDVPGKNHSEIFSSINKWISLNYNSAQNVVQLNDKEAGNIIVKGINEVLFKNVMKELTPNNKYMQDYSTMKFNHTIEINIRDDKFRVVYTLTDIVTDPVMKGYEHLNDLAFNLIDLTGITDESVMLYNNSLEEIFPKSFIGNKKFKKIQELTKPAYEQLNEDIKTSIKGTMESIENSVKSTEDSDW